MSSPLNDEVCLLCNKAGHRLVSGRLLYCDGEKWIHSNCALWTEEVKENI